MDTARHCRCAHGVLKVCYGEGDLELFEGELDLRVEGWQTDKLLSLRKAAHLSNPLNEFQSSCCNCKSGCKTLNCVCRKKSGTCSTKCHGGRSCTNQTLSPSPQKPPRKRPQTEEDASSDDEGETRSPSTQKPPKKRLRTNKTRSNKGGEAVSKLPKKQLPITISSDKQGGSDSDKWLPSLHLTSTDKEILVVVRQAHVGSTDAAQETVSSRRWVQSDTLD